MPELPGEAGSCWTSTVPPADFPVLREAVRAETVVVGGGIVGLTTALRLCEEGRSVVLLEGLSVGRQVTGRSTAKITTQHRLIYRDLIDTRGEEMARLYAEANRDGCDLIDRWVVSYGVECDFERRDAYVYTREAALRPRIEAEANAARSLGLTAEVLDRAPLPFDTAAALRFPHQAQFNPAAYLVGIARAFIAHGGRIFENSRARVIEEGNRWRVRTDEGEVEAENLVVATNMTAKSPVGMANRTQPRSHIAMAFRLADEKLIDGMFISAEDPGHSLRTGRDAAGPLLIVLGPRFDTGHEGDVAGRFLELEDWVRRNLFVGDTVWRWCNEDYDTPDRVPYVGEPDPDKAPGFYIATGFNAWGISNGTAAGAMIADQICGRDSPWKALYDPVRPYPEDFHRNGESRSIVTSVADIAAGHGGVLVQGDEKIAVWKDETGQTHAFSAACTHKGCILTWNNADRTWDCPCHGSIFSADGSVIHGPAREPLRPASL